MPWRDSTPKTAVQHTPQRFLNPTKSEPMRGGASTLGMVSNRARDQMVARLESAGIASSKVLQAMRQVPRHAYVDSGLASRAYEEATLPIGFKQTISAPSVVARMLELACGASQTVGAWLEIGTGCGYQAAVMAACTQQVCSVERIEGLAQLAKQQLAQQGVRNITLLHGDGLLSWRSQYASSHGKQAFDRFDAIVVAAAGLGIAPIWLEQLAIGGRLVAPVQGEDGVQRLHVVERCSEHAFDRHTLEAVQFVPLLQGRSHPI
jgi:protein-L-isoaspartate(D-aspartate) O-methyltransferase